MNILNKLTLKHLKMNKKRTVVTIIGVILSTALMVGIGLLLSTVRDNTLQQAIQNSGSHHVVFKDVSNNKKDLIYQNNDVKKAKATNKLGYAFLENGSNEYKPYLKVLKVDAAYLQDLKLISGKLPQNDNEIVISNHIASNGGVHYEVGDKITLQIGKRLSEGTEDVTDVISYTIDETLIDTITKEYTITGIVERDILENYSDCGYSIFTTGDFQNSDGLSIYVEYKKVKDTYKLSESIGKNLGYEDYLTQAENIRYNDSVLALYGVSKYDNFTGTMANIMIVMLTLVSIGCIIVIYNSFAISVMERKKQFGLFASIGTTKKQLRKTVFFEAFIIGLIGIPLGILGSYIGIGTVIAIINYLLPDMFASPLRLVTYPLFIIIPVVFMIIVILLSAYLPAKRASRTTPIEAIRQNDDIKIKGKIKTKKWVQKIFGVEGDIAHKNMQRNKKKYRITTLSLVISIVLFVSFSAFMNYTISSSETYLEDMNFTSYLYYQNKDNDSKIKEQVETALKHEQVDKSLMTKKYQIMTHSDLSSIYTKEFKKLMNDYYGNMDQQQIDLIVLSNQDYDAYLKQIGKTEIKPILYNHLETIIYTTNSRKAYVMDKYQGKTTIELYNITESEDEPGYVTVTYDEDSYGKIDDFYISDVDFLGSTLYQSQVTPTIIVRESEVSKYINEDTSYNGDFAFIQAKKYDKLDESIKKAMDNNELSGNYENIYEEMRMIKNVQLVVRILVYGFISLVTLIGVTSVFNTINTSIALRRKEFAMLRSMGLTPKGFNRIICFESLFVGLRSLIIGLPISLLVTLFLHVSFGDMVSISKALIPWGSMLIATLGVFIIILLSMTYSTHKIKKENILEAIREENI